MGKTTTELHLYVPEQGLLQLKKGCLQLQRTFPWLVPYTRVQPSSAKYAGISDAELLRQWRLEYDKLPAAIQALLSFADFKAQSKRLQPVIEKAIRDQRGEQVSAVSYPVQLYQSLSAWRLFPSALSHFAWSCLADQFAGLSLAINTQASVLAATKQRLTLLRPVQYGVGHTVQRSADNPIPGFFCDALELSALQEWRFALYEKGQPPVDSLKVSRSLIKRIYIGPMASDTLIEQVLNLVRHDLRYRSVPVFQVKVDQHIWRLTAEKINC